MTKELSIIIPVYNSESCLMQTVDRVVAALDKLKVTYEIILIDDGSSDQSWSVIKQLKLKKPFIVGVKLRKNFGQHNALLCGVNLADANYIVTIDDDLEQNPDDIEKLYSVIKTENFDLVYAIPINIKKNLLRSFVTKIYKKISRIENKKAGDGSAFRIFSKSLRNNLLDHDGPLFFLDEIALWYTDNIGFKSVHFQKSLKKSSGYSFGSLFTLSLRVMSLSSTMPLKIVRVLGIYISVISIFLASYFILRKIIFKVPSGYTSIIVAVLFSSGIITFSLGIIGEYLANLISLSNKKPSYSIKEKI